jgi:tRNA pseudouridine38-40 synthase
MRSGQALSAERRRMKNYKIVLSYDGTDYFGWQRQPDRRTIQGIVEDAVERLAGKKIAVHGAGRTDAGVHALGQTASFKAALRMDEAELRKAFNGILPRDIRVLTVEMVPASFHARKSARGKIYQYRIMTSPAVSPFDLRYVHHWTYEHNLRRMQQAARLFVREGDFTGFSSNQDRSPVRCVTRSELRRKGDELIYTIEANGFLRYMVRTIVGTILEAGRGRLPLERIEAAFAEKKRSLGSPTAPARGLCLVEVKY